MIKKRKSQWFWSCAITLLILVTVLNTVLIVITSILIDGQLRYVNEQFQLYQDGDWLCIDRKIASVAEKRTRQLIKQEHCEHKWRYVSNDERQVIFKGAELGFTVGNETVVYTTGVVDHLCHLKFKCVKCDVERTFEFCELTFEQQQAIETLDLKEKS